jgi:hypothetical protein
LEDFDLTPEGLADLDDVRGIGRGIGEGQMGKGNGERGNGERGTGEREQI